MHGMDTHDEIEYWRARAARAESELAAMTVARNEACRVLHDIGSHDDEYGYAVDVAADLCGTGK